MLIHKRIVYGVAERQSTCHGHGDYSTEDKICRIGSYGTGEFPPLFRTHAAAKEWLTTNRDRFLGSSLKVVPLTLQWEDKQSNEH